MASNRTFQRSSRGWLVRIAGISGYVVVVAGCSARLAGGLDEARANEAVAYLEEHGVDAEKLSEGSTHEPRFAIEVARADLGEALGILRTAALPREPEPGIAETYQEPSLVPSPSEDRARYLAAVAGELARTLQRIDGVVDARVHVASPDTVELALDAPAPPARASVLLITRRGAHVDPASVRAIVVGAVDGLAPGSVSVVVLPASPGPRARARLARVGPFRVAPASASPLAWVLAGSVALHAGSVISVVELLRRRRRRGVGEPAG